MANALVVQGSIGAVVSILLELAKDQNPLLNLVLKGFVAFASVRLSLKYFSDPELGGRTPSLRYAYSTIVLLAVITGLLKKE